MDNYNNQNMSAGQQYKPPYETGINQYHQYQQYQPPYGAGVGQGQQYQALYDNSGQSYYTNYTYNSNANIANSQAALTNVNSGLVQGRVQKKGLPGILNASMIFGVIGSIIMFIGLMMPAIDFSHFHQEVDIQYNLFKVGKNVGLISAMWNVIPYVILVSIIVIVILSLIRIPILKLLPILLILCMLILMLVDMGNVAAWATNMLDKVGIVLEKDITVREIFKSLMPGMYIMVVGWIVSLVSCFVKIKE